MALSEAICTYVVSMCHLEAKKFFGFGLEPRRPMRTCMGYEAMTTCTRVSVWYVNGMSYTQ